jgi:hypothetical protein
VYIWVYSNTKLLIDFYIQKYIFWANVYIFFSKLLYFTLRETLPFALFLALLSNVIFTYFWPNVKYICIYRNYNKYTLWLTKAVYYLYTFLNIMFWIQKKRATFNPVKSVNYTYIKKGLNKAFLNLSNLLIFINLMLYP